VAATRQTAAIAGRGRGRRRQVESNNGSKLTLQTDDIGGYTTETETQSIALLTETSGVIAPYSGSPDYSRPPQTSRWMVRWFHPSSQDRRYPND
jgi:hypothetical protein